MSKVLLIDDERSFLDGRECDIARSSADAVRLLENSADGYDEVWFDFVLGGNDDIMNVLFFLSSRKKKGKGIRIGKCYLHTSSNSGKALLRKVLEEDGYFTVGVTTSEFFDK